MDDVINTDHNIRFVGEKRGLTVDFVQDKLISGDVQFSQVQVNDFSISLLKEITHKVIFYSFIPSNFNII